MGSTVTEIVGIVTHAFGFYTVLPLTAPTVIAHNETLQDPTTLTIPADDTNCTPTFGDYNVENMTYNSTLPVATSPIGDYLKSPDIVFLEEIQDGTGSTNGGVVSSNRTSQAFVDAISAHRGVNYSYVYIRPVGGQDGGDPGENIRPAFLYRPERLKLVNPTMAGPWTRPKS